jgi:F-type H+-transporting ATPase subunit delta
LSSKSTFSSSTSRSYAVALYELCKESGEIDKTKDDLKSLQVLLIKSREFKDMVLSPMIAVDNKKNVLLKIADQNNFSKILKNFLGFISTKNRLFFLDKIIESFLNLVSNSQGELKARLVSSKKLSTEEQEKIQKELSKDFSSTLNISYDHNPNLIGGLIVQVGSVMIDTSIKTKLKKLEKNMIEA